MSIQRHGDAAYWLSPLSGLSRSFASACHSSLIVELSSAGCGHLCLSALHERPRRHMRPGACELRPLPISAGPSHARRVPFPGTKARQANSAASREVSRPFSVYQPRCATRCGQHPGNPASAFSPAQSRALRAEMRVLPQPPWACHALAGFRFFAHSGSTHGGVIGQARMPPGWIMHRHR